MNNDEIINKHEQDLPETLDWYAGSLRDQIVKILNEARADERAKIIEMLKDDLKKWRAGKNNNDPQVNIGIIIQAEATIKELEELKP